MRLFIPAIAAGLALFAASGWADQVTPTTGPYRVQRIVKVGGDGGFDYVYADADGRKLYIARGGPAPRVTAFNLDTLAPAGEIPMTNARGVASDAKSHHAFASSNPVAMWDTNTMALIKTIPVEGGPDGILNDPFTHRVFVFSHRPPNVTVIDANDGTVVGTIDLGGAPEEAATDGKGRVYVNVVDKATVAVIDPRTLKVTSQYSLNGKGSDNGGLALDVKNHILFVACGNPQVMVMLDANDGKYLADLPIGRGCDGATFNPKTMEAFSSQGDGTLTVIKENSPTRFVVEQNVQTMPGAKTCTLDAKTGRILLIAAEYGPAPTPPDGGGGPGAGGPGGGGPGGPGGPGGGGPGGPGAGGPGGGGRRGPGGGRGFFRRPMLPGSFSIVVVGK